MPRFSNAWQRLWFTPGPALDLAVPRVLLCGFLLARNAGVDRGAIGSPFAQELWRPISFFRLLGDHMPSPDQLELAGIAWGIALALGCIGLMTRTSMTLSFVLGLFVIGWGQNFGKIMHSHHVALMCTGILAFSRCGDALSIDAWLRRRRGRPAPSNSSEYTWPLRCAWLAMTLMFFGAGVAKLRHGGLEWIFSDSFSNLLILKQYDKPSLGGLGLYVARLGWVGQLLAGASVAAELFAPLALVSRRLRLLIIPTLFGMQLGIALLMGVHPRSPNFACYAFFVPWQSLVDRWIRRPTG